MLKVRLCFFIIIALLLTGCTKVDKNIDNIINEILSDNRGIVNTASTSYELYIPIGVAQVKDNEYNQKLMIGNRYVYLYVDTISYYYKNSLNYKNNGQYDYYYKKISFNNKEGYIGINKVSDDLFFCDIVYNYSKIEFYADSHDLPFILSNSLIVVNNIKYNDNLIKGQLDLENNIGKDVKFEFDSPNDADSDFNDYLEEYVEEEDTETELPVDE